MGACRPCPRAQPQRCRRTTARVPAFHHCTQAPVIGQPPSRQAKRPAWQGKEQPLCTHKAVPSSTSVTEATDGLGPSQRSRSLLGCLGSAPVLPSRWTQTGSPGRTAHSQMGGGGVAGNLHASGSPNPQQSSGSQPGAEGHSGGFPASATMKSGLEAAQEGHETAAQSQSPANGQLRPPGPQPAHTIVMQGGKPLLSQFPTAIWLATYKHPSASQSEGGGANAPPFLNVARVQHTYSVRFAAGLLGPTIEPDDGAAGPTGVPSKRATSNGRISEHSSANGKLSAAVTSPSPTPSGGVRQPRCPRAFATILHPLSDAEPPTSRRPAKAQTEVNRHLAEQSIICMTL